jgi:hypothetical protein
VEAAPVRVHDATGTGIPVKCWRAIRSSVSQSGGVMPRDASELARHLAREAEE